MGLPGLRRVADRYQFTELLGRGGMGTVWRAEDELLGRPVAIKVIQAPDTLLEPPAEPGNAVPAEASSAYAQTSGRALREARAAGRLNHPGAVTVYDIVEEDDRFHIVMELIQAPTLADLVRTSGSLPPARVAAIGGQLLEILVFAHINGIVHRDVKPSNVMVLAHDRVKLTDFGIAWLRGDPQLTASGTTLGSPMFMAPEQAAGRDVGPPADLWALGATMYYAVEGRAPFNRPTAMAVLAAILSQPPDPVRLAGSLGPTLTALLVQDPQSRPDGVVLRRLLSLAAVGADGSVGVNPLNQATADVTLDAVPTAEVPASPVIAPARAVTTATAIPVFGSPEPGSPARITDRPVPAVDRSVPARRRDVTVLKGLVAVLTAAVATLSFALWHQDPPPTNPSGSVIAGAGQNRAPAKQPTGAEELSTKLAPSAPNAPSTGLALGSAGRTGLVRLKHGDGAPRGQLVPDFFESATNPVGGYAVGVPSAFDTYAVGPTTFVEWNETMFQAGFEVHSYRAVDPWARLTQDEKLFAKDHAIDHYTRKQLARHWTYANKPATIWEFTWMRNGVLTHGREVAFQVGNRTYTVLYRSTNLWWLGGGTGDYPSKFEQSFFPLP